MEVTIFAELTAAVAYIISHKHDEFNYRIKSSCILNVNLAYANQKVHEVKQLECTMSMNVLRWFCN